MMPDVKIKGWSGTDFSYADVPKIWLNAAESTEESPVLVPYTYGEAVSKTVTPDFSAGDMVVIPEDGTLLGKVTITKPETLVPEHIAEGISIAGIVGTLAAGGGTSTFDYANSDITAIGAYAYKGMTGMRASSFPNATTIGKGAFNNCTDLEEFSAPLVTEIDVPTSILWAANHMPFCDCDKLRSLSFPALVELKMNTIGYCDLLSKIDFGAVETIGENFMSLQSLETVIVRSGAVADLTYKNTFTGYGAFYNTKIGNGSGYIYVPSSLVSAYQAANNWSDYAAQIRAIEDYPDICG